MKHVALVSCPLTLFIAAQAAAQEVPAEPIPAPADHPPLIIEAESGLLGAEHAAPRGLAELRSGDLHGVAFQPAADLAGSLPRSHHMWTFET